MNDRHRPTGIALRLSRSICMIQVAFILAAWLSHVIPEILDPWGAISLVLLFAAPGAIACLWVITCVTGVDAAKERLFGWLAYSVSLSIAQFVSLLPFAM